MYIGKSGEIGWVAQHRHVCNEGWGWMCADQLYHFPENSRFCKGILFNVVVCDSMLVYVMTMMMMCFDFCHFEIDYAS